MTEGLVVFVLTDGVRMACSEHEKTPCSGVRAWIGAPMALRRSEWAGEGRQFRKCARGCGKGAGECDGGREDSVGQEGAGAGFAARTETVFPQSGSGGCGLWPS